jgi:putative chitinase
MSGEIESCDNTWIEIGASRYVEAKAIGKCPKGISQADFEATTPELKHDKAQLYIHHLNAAMIEADINTCIRRAAFIAQMGHESGGFNAFISMLYDSDYNKELGNNEPGDGAKFRGRGPLQMKGRKNYREASDALGVDFLKNPELVETRQWGFRVAAFLWKKNNLNAFADTGREEDYDRITYALNYGYHGKPDRDFRFRIAQRALEC